MSMFPAPRPSTDLSRRARRRLERVSLDPQLATVDDVRLLLGAHGVDHDEIGEVVVRIGRTRLEPSQVWEWVMCFDGIELARLCSSGWDDEMVVTALVDGLTIHRAFG